MLNDAFFIYANNSFRDDPNNLYHLFNEIGYDTFRFCASEIKELIDWVVKISEYNSPYPKLAGAKNLLYCELCDHFFVPDPQDIRTPDKQEWFKSAYQAVCGFASDSCDDYCKSKCQYRLIRKSVLKDQPLAGPNRLKCYECDQLFFREILEKITNNVIYTDITGFFDLLTQASLCVRRNFWITRIDSGKSYTDKITETRELVPHGFFGPDYGIARDRFKEFVYGIVGYSLVDFLSKNDRHFLKLCPYCNNFFIAKRRNRKSRCYDKECERAYQREKKRKQREKEPDIYRY